MALDYTTDRHAPMLLNEFSFMLFYNLFWLIDGRVHSSRPGHNSTTPLLV